MSVAQKVPNIRETLARSSEGVTLIGWFVYWSMADVSIEHNDLLTKMAALGLNKDAAPQIRAKSAFIRATEEIAKGRKARHQKIIDDSTRCIYVIVSTHVDPVNVDVAFTVEHKIIFNKQDNTISVADTSDVGMEVVALAQKYAETYYSDQLRETVLRLLGHHCQFITVRDRGGIYFVPSVHEEELKKIQKLVDQFPGCSVETVGIADMAEARKSMWKSLVGEVTHEINLMKADLHDAVPDMSDSSMKIRMDRYAALREKVENYEIVLNGTASELKGELAMLGRSLAAKLGA